MEEDKSKKLTAKKAATKIAAKKATTKATTKAAKKVAPAPAPAPAQNKEHFVAFLDILGFKEMGSVSGSKYRIIKIIDKIADWEKNLKSHLIKRKIAVLKMSDSLVLSIRADIPGALINLIEACRELQGDLYSLNPPTLIRGAITKGEYRKTKKVAYGEAVINAYKYQEEYSKYPRVIISYNLIRNEQKAKNLSTYDTNRLLFLDADKYFFIDCLKYRFLNKSSNDPECVRFERFIIGNLDYAPQNVREKYIWLHDNFGRIKMLRNIKGTRIPQNSRSTGNLVYVRKKIVYTLIYRAVLKDGSLDV